MPNADEITHQQELLAIHRRNLAHQIRRATQYGGEAFAPPEVANGIHEARRSIRVIKAWLRQHSVAVEDQRNDEATGSGGTTAAPIMPQPSSTSVDDRLQSLGTATAAYGGSGPRIPTWAIVVINVIAIALSIVTNVATNALPDSWKPHLWLSFPIIVFLIIVSVVFAVWQNQQSS